MRKLVLWAVLALVLAVANGSILVKGRLLADGATVLLELAPCDPRSLLQGDHMALRYRLSAAIGDRLGERPSASGVAVVTLDGRGVASLLRLGEAGEALADGELLLRYRKRGKGVRVASDAFFFTEGQGARYARARFGELKVAADGDAVLVGLRDAEFARMGTEPAPPSR